MLHNKNTRYHPKINMDMSNLVAFGCSLTFGHGLSDCFIPPMLPGKDPSKLAWPTLVAGELGMECVNRAVPGAGNFEIALNVMSHAFLPDDWCFIMWSYPNRDLIINDSGIYERIGTWSEPKRFGTWLDLNPTATMTAKFWFNVLSINNYLWKINVKFINLTVGFELLAEHRPSWAKNIKFLEANINRYRHRFPKALDARHPGELAHRAFANDVLKELGDKIRHGDLGPTFS